MLHGMPCTCYISVVLHRFLFFLFIWIHKPSAASSPPMQPLCLRTKTPHGVKLVLVNYALGGSHKVCDLVEVMCLKATLLDTKEIMFCTEMLHTFMCGTSYKGYLLYVCNTYLMHTVYHTLFVLFHVCLFCYEHH